MFRKHAVFLIALAWLVATQASIWTLPAEARLDRDEGYNLIKASLVSEGYRLYDDIWSDQPPLFTYLMAATDRWVGALDDADRALVSLHAAILLLTVGCIARRLGGSIWAGVTAMVLLLSARQMGKMSMAVMIGLPAVTWALVACLLLLHAAGRRPVLAVPLVILAGVIFAGAFLIKMFAAILLPFAIALLFWGWRRRQAGEQTPRAGALLPAILFLVALSAVAWFAGPGQTPGWRAQLVDVHTVRLPRDELPIWSVGARFLEDTPLMLTTILLASLAGRRGLSCHWPALVWLGASIAALSQANPVWGHHRIMLIIPMALVAGASAGSLLKQLREPGGSLVTLGPKWLVLGVLPVVVAGTLAAGAAQRFTDLCIVGRTPEDQIEADMLAAVRSAGKPGDFLLTDDPHVAIVTGMHVSPKLAVWSHKRQVQGLVPDEMVIEVRNQMKPAVIVFDRHLFDAEREARLTEGYERILKKAHRRVYRRIEIQEAPGI